MQEQLHFILNNEEITGEFNGSSSLLSFIRNTKKLTGTKLVCREGDCGACTVLVGELIKGNVEYRTVTSCIFPLAKVNGKHVVTVEGINNTGLTPVQSEFVNEGATQCGFCTPGFIMSLTWYLITHSDYDLSGAINALGGNICRCTGYASIIRSAENVINALNNGNTNGSINLHKLIELNVLPEYFAGIKMRLEKIKEKIHAGIVTGDRPVWVGGGTDLYVQKFESLVGSRIALTERLGRSYILEDNNAIRLSGNATFEEFKNSGVIKKYFPGLQRQFNLIASLPIRNSATIAGNIVNASPIGDLTIILLALDATLVLSEDKNKREVKLKDFYKGYKSLNKSEDEIITEIYFENNFKNQKFNFEKVSKRTYLDIASVNTAMFVEYIGGEIKRCGISAGGVAPVPLFLKNTSEFLTGKKIENEIIEEALDIAQSEISPISDVRGSEAYKRLLLNQLIKAHFIEMFHAKIDVKELI